MTETELGRPISPQKHPPWSTISRTAWGLCRRISILQTACLAFSLGLVLIPVLDGAGVYVSGMVGLFLPMVTLLGFLATAPFALYRMVFGKKRGVSRFSPVAALIVSLTLVFGFNIGKHVTKWNFQHGWRSECRWWPWWNAVRSRRAPRGHATASISPFHADGGTSRQATKF